MAVSDHKVSSPDGRTWAVTSSWQWRSFKESHQAPYFWGHVIATTIMVLFSILVLESHAFKFLSVFIPIVFIVWLVGFLNSTIRMTISADTAGPPVEHRLWVVVKRLKRKRCVRALDKAIQAGRYTTEPEGTRLEEI